MKSISLIILTFLSVNMFGQHSDLDARIISIFKIKCLEDHRGSLTTDEPHIIECKYNERTSTCVYSLPNELQLLFFVDNDELYQATKRSAEIEFNLKPYSEDKVFDSQDYGMVKSSIYRGIIDGSDRYFYIYVTYDLY